MTCFFSVPGPRLDPAGLGELGGPDHVHADRCRSSESSAPSRRTSCSRCWLASVGRNSGVDLVARRSIPSEQRSATSSIVPPGWIATKKVSSRGPDRRSCRRRHRGRRRPVPLPPGRPGPSQPLGMSSPLLHTAPPARDAAVLSRDARVKVFLNRLAGRRAARRAPGPRPATAESSGAWSPAARARTRAPSIVETTRPAKVAASVGADAFVAQRRGDRPLPSSGRRRWRRRRAPGPRAGPARRRRPGSRSARGGRRRGGGRSRRRWRASRFRPRSASERSIAVADPSPSSSAASARELAPCRRGSGGRSSRGARCRARRRRAAPSRRSPSRRAAGGRRSSSRSRPSRRFGSTGCAVGESALCPRT